MSARTLLDHEASAILVSMNASDKVLKRIVDIIVDSVSPNKIVLFGSRARGDARFDSDYDLLVVKSGLENERNVSRAIYRRMLNESIDVPIDIIAVDADRYERNKADPGLIYSSIENTGIVLYG
jgi:uncharacterized protein